MMEFTILYFYIILYLAALKIIRFYFVNLIFGG